MTQNLVVATAYATLETNAVIQAESEEEVSALVCNRKAAEGTFLALFNRSLFVRLDQDRGPKAVRRGHPLSQLLVHAWSLGLAAS